MIFQVNFVVIINLIMNVYNNNVKNNKEYYKYNNKLWLLIKIEIKEN